MGPLVFRSSVGVRMIKGRVIIYIQCRDCICDMMPDSHCVYGTNVLLILSRISH
jgi:hypothetical protein